ncbi:MAG: BrnT family toxin [Spirochaetia bacterium]|nr:BrnT family toxin [Spirochaetia bacterium]
MKNHGYSFKEVESVFDDPFFVEFYDKAHSSLRQTRFFGLGSIGIKCLVLQVSYTENERIHIITARDATPKERNVYYEKLREIHRGMRKKREILR